MRRLTDNEDGAIAVIVGISLVVMLGLGAIAVDVAALFSERRELQNGADAAVLAVAENCASASAEAGCDIGPQGDRLATARTFANSNATDGSAAVADDGVDVEFSARTATVVTTSLNDGEGFLRHWFAPIFGADPTEVVATAEAQWGELGLPPELDTIPVALSMCDFMGGPGPWTLGEMDAKADGLPKVETLPQDAAGNVTDPGVRITLHDPNKDTDACTFQPGFAGDGETKLPGGFQWLDTESGCNVNIVKHELNGEFWVPSKNGMSPAGRTCLTKYVQQRPAPTIPIFTGFEKSGKTYRLYAPGAFYVTGIDIPGSKISPPSGASACGGGQWCIWGHFVQKVDLGIPPGGGPSLGLTGVELTR